MKNNDNYFHKRVYKFHDELNQILEGKMPKPKVAFLHPNYACNYKCTGCDFFSLIKSKNTSWTNRDFKHILNKIISFGIKFVEFSGGGEPLLSPDIGWAIDKLHRNKISVGILTNGRFLQEDLLKTIIKCCSYVRISLESGSKEVFSRVKNTDPNEFNIIIENVKEALKLKKILKSPVEISLKYTIGKDNLDDIENILRITNGLDIDSIQFKNYRNVSNELKEWKPIQEKLNKLKEKYPHIRIISNIKPTKIKRRCWITPVFMVIDCYGDVYLCTYYRHRRKTHRIGNVFKESMEDIWFSEGHNYAIKNIKKEECNLYNCRFHKYVNEYCQKEK